MLKKLLILAALLVVLVVGVLAALPATYAVRAARDFEVDHDAVLAFVGDLSNWPEWLAGHLDEGERKKLELRFSERTSGAGAFVEFDHDRLKGKLTITRVDPAVGLFYDLEVEGVAPGKGQLGVVQKAKGPVTVSFSVTGEMPFLARPLRPSVEAEFERWFDDRLVDLERRFVGGD